MKLTFDLPDDVARRLKRRAVRDGRSMTELAAAILRQSLPARGTKSRLSRPIVVKDKVTGLPVIQCGPMPPRNKEMTPDEIARILIEQESAWVLGGE